MSFVIQSYFAKGGTPQTGLSPTIRIWEVDGTTSDIIIGSPNGTGNPGGGVGTDGVMTEVIDGVSKDGEYKFEFTVAMGYDPTKSYSARADGGVTLPPADRYQYATFDATDNVTIQNLVDGVLDEPRAAHIIGGTVGEAINLDRADISAIRTTDLPTLYALIDLLRKYAANRTKLDPVNHTLTVFDDDCTTVLRVFYLLDQTGTPDAANPCERDPDAALNAAANGGGGSSDTTSTTCP